MKNTSLCALSLALQAQGRTAPNPVVGAVVLDASGAVVGEGFHARAGQAHAEVEALMEQENARKAERCTSILNLAAIMDEPGHALKE